ncbi:SIS domain-containing protein [Streptomyces oceani]|uniref:SIS domain-containing protein n=1 Tax=Streptomyces oceani TaxID=1075402 RepID=A0A1E7KMG6_9ACTN|nr:SIS domain-containing protein [Streptomyces oceani]OEV05097.1 hypothetical protein AN216_04595 [Streptomyces oceani]
MAQDAQTAPQDLGGDYLDAAIRLLTEVRRTEHGGVRTAAGILGDAVERGARLFVFGAGHSALPAQDVVYRAGGLAVFNLLSVPGLVGVDVRPATLGSALERVSGLASTVLDASPARSGDVLIVISLSGRNELPVEMAMTARARGLRVIGLTSTAYARETTSRHSSGSFLVDHCEVVLDNHVPVGDAELTTPGIPAPFAPASTVVTSALIQAMVAETVGELRSRGLEPPLLRSGNVDGGHEWNARVLSDHADRIFYGA